MATSASDGGVLFGGVEWSSSPVTFHRNTGSVKLTESNTVATRGTDHNCAIVFTSEPMVVGQMLKVTVTEKKGCWIGGMVRGIAWLST